MSGKSDYEDYSTDEGGKKRKANKSPPKQNKREEGKLDLILTMITDMKMEQHEIKKELEGISREQKSLSLELKNLKLENEKLSRENSEIKKENIDIKNELREIKATAEWLEKENKKNNIIINGYTIRETEQVNIINEISRFMKENLDTEIKIKAARKIGTKTCVVTLYNELEKEKVMREKIKLRNVEGEKIYINDDLTKKEKEKQRTIIQIAKEAKEKNKNVKVGYNKVTIDGVVWRWNKSTEKLEISQPKN